MLANVVKHVTEVFVSLGTSVKMKVNITKKIWILIMLAIIFVRIVMNGMSYLVGEINERFKFV